jgi:hypothetical protein
MRWGRSSAPSADPIAAFWAWWPGARPRVEQAIDGAGWDGLVDEVSARVSAIAPKLDWEFGKGRRARHALVLSAVGNPGLRSTTERWMRAGPPADAGWEFHPARQAEPAALESTLDMDGDRLDLRQLRFGYTAAADRRLDVTVHHPEFGRLPDRGRQRIAFLALDWLLGEDAVEVWIGAIDTAAHPIGGAGSELRDEVARLADAPPQWALLQGTPQGGQPVTATIQTPLRPARWPLFDQHVAVLLGYRQHDSSGMPAKEDLDALRAFEDQLRAALDHSAALVAHETTAGQRTLHLYAAADSPAEQVATRLAAGWSAGPATVSTRPDATWSGVEHLRS